MLSLSSSITKVVVKGHNNEIILFLTILCLCNQLLKIIEL